MLVEKHQDLAEFIWYIANKLRGPYRPPQYRRVMLPMIVLRRLDCVLEPTKAALLKEFDALKKKGLKDAALDKALANAASKDRQQPLYNVSPYTFAKLLGDPNGLAKNLTSYIKGFSPKVREIFEKFEFEKEIEKLDETNRLFEASVRTANMPGKLHAALDTATPTSAFSAFQPCHGGVHLVLPF